MEKNGDREGSERRRFIRRRIPCKIFFCCPKEKIFSAHTEDICEEGVQVIIDEPLPVNTAVKVELFLEDDPILCDGRIAWIKENGGKTPDGKLLYNVGIEIESRHFFE